MIFCMSFGNFMPWKESKGSQEECYVVLRGVSREKGVYALEKMKTTQQDGLYTYGRKFVQRNESLCIWKMVRGGNEGSC